MPVIVAPYLIEARSRVDAAIPAGNPQRDGAMYLVVRLWNSASPQDRLRGGSHPREPTGAFMTDPDPRAAFATGDRAASSVRSGPCLWLRSWADHAANRAATNSPTPSITMVGGVRPDPSGRAMPT